jgi:uncharacterized caspase-like protein
MGFFSVESLPARKALVIGNDSYSTAVGELKNARADARAIAGSLAELGFQVTTKTDLSERAMRAAVREFTDSLNGGDEALFFYAGHAVQFGGGNYLLPVDIDRPRNEAQVRDESLPLDRILDDLAAKQVRFSIAIIDACRDNPFPKVGGRSIGSARGLAPTNPATGQMVMFSAGSGQTALDSLGDSDKDPNGLFTRVLLKQLRETGISADQLLRRVREDVVVLARSIGHEQVPALYDQAIGSFVFRDGSRATQPEPTSASTTESVSEVVGSALPSPPRSMTGVPERPVVLRRVAVTRFGTLVDAASWRAYRAAKVVDIEDAIDVQLSKIEGLQVITGLTDQAERSLAEFELTGSITEYSAGRATDTSRDRTELMTLTAQVRLVRVATGEVLLADSVRVEQPLPDAGRGSEAHARRAVAELQRQFAAAVATLIAEALSRSPAQLSSRGPALLWISSSSIAMSFISR